MNPLPLIYKRLTELTVVFPIDHPERMRRLWSICLSSSSSSVSSYQPMQPLLSRSEQLWHSIGYRATTFWHRIVETVPLSSKTLSELATIAEDKAAGILMELSQRLSAPLAPTCDDQVFSLRSTQGKQTITVPGRAVYFGSSRVIIPINHKKRPCFAYDAYRAFLETALSIDDLRCFHVLHTDILEKLDAMLEQELKRSRDTRIALRKPRPMIGAFKVKPKHIRRESIRWKNGSKHIKWLGQFQYLRKKGMMKLEKFGKKSRKIRVQIREMWNLIEECEARIWEVDQNEMIEERNEIRGPRTARRWREGRRGWTGLTPDEISPRRIG